MLSILGVGAAYPETIIDNSFLENLQTDWSAKRILEETGITSRNTTLPLDYIVTTRNRQNLDSRGKATITPSELGLAAAKSAIALAGISVEDIGLIIGDSTTPLETTPSEAQRIGKLLGLKVPAYDLVSGGNTLCAHLSVLGSWIPEKTPTYILSMSADTPTRCIDYSGGREMHYFGDAAAAMVISLKVEGKIRAHKTGLRLKASNAAPFVINHDGFLRVDCASVEEQVISSTRELLSEIEESISVSDSIFVGPQYSGTALDKIKDGSKIHRILSNVSERGCSLGSSTMATLAERWEQLQKGDKIVVAQGGVGRTVGYAYLEVL